MEQQQVSAKITNRKTYWMYLQQMLSIASNVFLLRHLPLYIDRDYVNRILLMEGSIAFFYDEILETILALPYTQVGRLDMYGRPKRIRVYGQNGYSRFLDSYEFVIMYDNSWKRPLYADIVQYASRMANIQRTIDINITQQKTNRIITADSSTLVSINDMLKKIDDNEETIVKFDGINLGNLDVKLTPAQIVFDKLEEQKEKTWAEFLRLVGVANLTTQKKERNIVDEIRAMQGGTIASRYTRFSPRQDAIDRINAMFKDKLVEPLSIDYYDGEPSTEEKTEEVGDEYDRSESI